MSAFIAPKNILVYILLFIIVEALQAACPPGWLTWQDSCYILLPGKMTWFEASKACDRLGASMVVPNSEIEHEFIWQEMKMRMEKISTETNDLELWIGCKDVDNTRTLICLGENGDPAYKNWADGEPNWPDDECVRIAERFGGKWGDRGCNQLKFVACEMEAVSCRRRPATSFIQVPHLCLLNHEIKSYPIKESIECGLACWAEPLCRSFNLLKKADEKICQLNNATQFEADVTDFKQSENCFFYERH